MGTVKEQVNGLSMRNWDQMARALGTTGPDYDYSKVKGLDDRGHTTDAGKLPWHPTFSNQSRYSTKKFAGGQWLGNDYQPSLDMLRFGNTHGPAHYMAAVEPDSKLLVPPPVSKEWFTKQTK